MRKNALFIAIFILIATANLNAQILSEDFENIGSLPDGWTQEYVTSPPHSWEFINGDEFEYSSHGGQYNAFYKSSLMWQDKAKLVTPELDIYGITNPLLKFWYMLPGSAGIDTLKVYYKTSSAGNWTLLDQFNVQIQDWTQIILELPDPTATYYIAFEASAFDMESRVLIDDVEVTGMTGIVKNIMTEDISVFFDCSQDIINITLPDYADIYINNIYGSMLKYYKGTKGVNSIYADLPGDGIYIIKIISGNNIISSYFIPIVR